MYKRDEENGWLDKQSRVYKELVNMLSNASQRTDELKMKYSPGLDGERYYTVAQVMDILHISRKTLREYRNNGLIAYTSIGGTILYPATKIEEILKKNYNGFFGK